MPHVGVVPTDLLQSPDQQASRSPIENLINSDALALTDRHVRQAKPGRGGWMKN